MWSGVFEGLVSVLRTPYLLDEASLWKDRKETGASILWWERAGGGHQGRSGHDTTCPSLYAPGQVVLNPLSI